MGNPVGRFYFIIYKLYNYYGISVGNFGTGIRHRSKFVIILIILAAPKLHKFVFYFKTKVKLLKLIVRLNLYSIK